MSAGADVGGQLAELGSSLTACSLGCKEAGRSATSPFAFHSVSQAHRQHVIDILTADYFLLFETPLATVLVVRL